MFIQLKGRWKNELLSRFAFHHSERRIRGPSMNQLADKGQSPFGDSPYCAIVPGVMRLFSSSDIVHPEYSHG
jgi:hypothetical protein